MSILLAGSALKSFMELLGALVIFAFVLVIVYLTTKWMGGLQMAKSNNKNLRIVETIAVGSNKYISIVEAGKVYLVVSVGKDEVHLLTRLTADELKEFSLEDTGGSETFAQIFDRLKDKFPKKQD